MINKDFSFYLTNFFADFLPNHRNCSKNTISLYKHCFILFLQFCKNEKHINIDVISFKDISTQLILEFLSWLENSRNCSIQTRNQRLAALKSFCKFVQFEEPQFFELCSSIRNIEPKKCDKNSLNYLSFESIKILLQQPQVTIKSEFKDLTLLTLMYETGARVQEIIDLHVYNLNLNNRATIHIVGKGNKTRIVPINKEITDILHKYISWFNLDSTDILFSNKYGKKLTRQGVGYILDKYLQRAREKNIPLDLNISPHCLRHSKAMHLLENGVNLIYIRDFLGHESVITTEIYAKANPEIRRKQIEKCSKSVVQESKFSANEQNNLLEFLKEQL